jgi:hypothetical protein
MQQGAAAARTWRGGPVASGWTAASAHALMQRPPWLPTAQAAGGVPCSGHAAAAGRRGRRRLGSPRPAGGRSGGRRGNANGDAAGANEPAWLHYAALHSQGNEVLAGEATSSPSPSTRSLGGLGACRDYRLNPAEHMMFWTAGDAGLGLLERGRTGDPVEVERCCTVALPAHSESPQEHARVGALASEGQWEP